MTKLLDHAISAATTLNDEDQDKLAYVLLDEAKRLAILEGIADAEAGRVVPHDDVKAWLESWGTENELPMPTCK
jgi:predicted transcriptional regulator